jgi:endonuclease YncB( thermonuclease family)
MWDYRAQLIRIDDADTIVILADQGFSGRQEEAIRLADVSAPELRDPGGAESKAFTQAWAGQLPLLRWPLYVMTQPNTNPEPSERRSFVRYIGTVYDYADRSRCLNDDLAAFLAQHPEWGSGS